MVLQIFLSPKRFAKIVAAIAPAATDIRA